MCRLRNIILHAADRAPAEVSRFRALNWFKPGDPLVIDRDKLLEVVDYIRSTFPDGLICGDDAGVARAEKQRKIEWPPPGIDDFSTTLQDSIATALRKRTSATMPGTSGEDDSNAG